MTATVNLLMIIAGDDEMRPGILNSICSNKVFNDESHVLPKKSQEKGEKLMRETRIIHEVNKNLILIKISKKNLENSCSLQTKYAQTI